MSKARSEQLYEIDYILFEKVEFLNISALYKKSPKKRSPTRKIIEKIDMESLPGERSAFADSPNQKKAIMTKKFVAKNYFSNTFPGDDDPKTFDKLERI